MYKRFSGVAWILAGLGLGCSQAAPDQGTTETTQPIHFGDVVSPGTAIDGPWVTIESASNRPGYVSWGSGILVSKDTVLTAAHVVDNVKTFDVAVSRGNRGATGANKPQKILAQTIAFHRSYHQFLEVWTVSPDGTFSLADGTRLTPQQRDAKIKDPGSVAFRIGVDLALIRLKQPFPTNGGWAAPYCNRSDLDALSQFDVVSGGVLRAGFSNVGVKNSATFSVDNPKYTQLSLNPFAGQVEYLHLQGNDITPAGKQKKRWQYIIGGDSGSGVLLPTSPKDSPNVRNVAGIISTGGDPPGTPVANSILLEPYCQWIQTVMNKLHSDADFDVREEIKIDDYKNKKLKGTLQRFIASLSSDGVEVELGAGDQVATYRVTLPTPPSEIRNSVVGSFSDRNAAIVFLDDGRIVARNVFDDTALPIDVPSGTEYKDLLVVNATSPTQTYNDLIAIKHDQFGADLYRGGPNGLTRAGVEGIAITRIDDDAAADVVLLDGSSLKVVTGDSVNSTTLPFSPRESASGKFTRNGVTAGRDLAFLSGGGQVALCAMTSDAAFSGSCASLTMPSGVSAAAIRATYFDSDQFEDLEVTAEDGRVAIFKGSASGLTFSTFVQGMPSARTDDGKLELLSGTQADTLGAPVSEFYVSEPVNASGSPTGQPLIVQLYDAGIYGSFDGSPDGSDVSTCVNVYASPTPGAANETLVKSIGETEYGPRELSWLTAFDSSVDGHSSEAVSASGVRWYRVELKLVRTDDECTAAPVVDHAAFNGFKLRTSGQLRSPNGHALYGSDAFGAFSSFESAPDTRFDGTFDIPFYVGGTTERPEIPGSVPVGITLRQADADDADHEGDADGQRDDIYFRLFRGTSQDGVALQVKRTDGQIEDDLNVATTTVEDPSGNASGASGLFETHTTEGLGTIQSGLHTWHWANVGAENAIQLQPVTGSPINHEFIAHGGRWLGSSGALEPAVLGALADEEIDALLPVEIGDAGFGQLRTFNSKAAIRKGLAASGEDDVTALLSRELLALKLNVKRARLKNEPLEAAFVLSTRVSVGELLKKVDTLLGGGEVDLAPEEALRLMAVANSGELTYLSPRELVLASADRDADGIPDAGDNCAMKANADQLDTNGDGIGDRCEPTPTVWCVEPRSRGGMTAVFGYESPLRDFRVPAGERNELSGEGVEQVPPVLFRRGVERQAVTVPFEGDSVTWTVLGKSVTATTDAPRCSDVGAGSAVCEASTSEFHCCVSIADCKAASDFGLYATETIRMGQRVRVLDENGRPGSVLSLGSIVMEAEAEAGDIAGGGELVVGDRVGLFGDIAVAGSLTELGGDLSPRVRKVPLDAPDLSAFSRPFSGSAGVEVENGSGRNRALDPGDYGRARFAGEVTLVAGEYHFTTLELLESGTLRIDAADGPVIVHVGGSVSLKGAVLAEPGDLLIELHGQGDVRVSTNLAATIIAPDGRIVVDRAGSVQFGAFYARAIELAADVTHVLQRPLAPRL